MGWLFDDEEETRRQPPKALRKLVWDRDKGICKICGKRAHPLDFELGHNKAFSKGGKLTERNTFVAHSSCNRSMGTQSVTQFRRELGSPESPQERLKKILKGLSKEKLRSLAKRYGLKVKGRVIEDWLNRYREPPSKTVYVNALAKIASEKEIISELRNV